MNRIELLIKLFGLKRNEKKSRKQILEIQERKLRRLLSYTWEHSSYYKKAWEEAGITKEDLAFRPLSDFPVMDKGRLMEHFDELVTVPEVTQEKLRAFDEAQAGNRENYPGGCHIVHSSGSTGKPAYFLYDEDAWSEMLLGMVRAALWGMTKRDILRFLAKGPRMVYVAATDGRYGGAMAVGDGGTGLGLSQITLDIKQPMEQWKEKLAAFQPNVIVGYPSAVKIMAQLAERGEISLSVIRIVTCGEPLGASLRSYLEGVFHTKILNFYGASESLVLGVEEDPREGMLLFDDENVIEVIDGQMYITCLYNYAQPLIRYRLSDRLKLREPEPDSRCPFTAASGLVGRNEDILWFTGPDGKREFLHPLAVEGFCIEGLKDYQFCQTAGDSFQLTAELTEPSCAERVRSELCRQLREILREKGLAYVRFGLDFVDEILPDRRTGKKKLITYREAYR